VPNSYEDLLARVKELQAEGKLPTTPTREQRISWAYGQTKIENAKVEMADAIRAVDAKPEFGR
jgi:hypothetical protein